MVVIYMGGSLIILIKKFTLLPETFHSIFYHTFNPTAAVGEFTAAMVKETIRFGITRGLFSNEAGLGSTPIAHAAANSLLKKADCGVPSRLAKATLKGLGLDGLTEQSAKL